MGQKLNRFTSFLTEKEICLRDMEYQISLLRTLEGHSSIVWHVAWSHCGTFLSSCGEDKIIRIWKFDFDFVNDKYDCHCVSLLEDGQTRTIRCCEWSTDGLLIASASFDGTILLWQCQSHDKNKVHWDKIASLEGHDNEVKCIAWNNDSTRLASCGRDKKIWLWEIMNEGEFECVSVLEGHTQDIKFLTWHPYEHIIFSCSYDDTIRIWKEESDDEWYCAQTLNCHKSTVWSLSLNANGDKFVSCSDDQSIAVWQSNQGNFEYNSVAVKQDVHTGPIYSTDWNKSLFDGHSNLIITASGDNSVVLNEYDNSTGLIHEVIRLDNAHDADINCVRWHNGSKDMNDTSGHQLFTTASDDGLIKIWRMKIT